jgi:hypothetical protein
VTPKFPPNLDTEMIRRMLLRTGDAPLSVGSGNAVSRALMESITRDGGFDRETPREMWMDWILEYNAPFYGQVLTIYEPQACYRIHDSNLYHINSIDPTRFAAECRSFEMKLEYFTGRCRKWGISFDPSVARNNSLWLLECRLVADKLSCTGGSLVWRTLFRALKVCINNEISVSKRVIEAAWLVGVAVSRRAVSLRLIELRFLPAKRPAWFQTVLTTIANFTAWGRSSRTEAMYR